MVKAMITRNTVAVDAVKACLIRVELIRFLHWFSFKKQGTL